MSSSRKKLTESNLESDMLKKLKFKSVNDVATHELNSLKGNRSVYLKTGNVFFLSTKEEALKALAKEKNTEQRN